MIIISPYAKPLLNGQENPKNYPHWKQFLWLVKEPIVQVGVEGENQLVPDFRKNLSVEALSSLILECRTWVSIDSFFQHLAWTLKKPGTVIFSQSDPDIFGHRENINLLKDRKYLREKQFWLWSQAQYNPEAYVTPDVVYKTLTDRGIF